MPEPSSRPIATTVARLSTDAAKVQTISGALAESFDPDAVAISAFEEADGRWSLALHFRDRPDEAAVRALVAAVAGAAAADALVLETLASDRLGAQEPRRPHAGRGRPLRRARGARPRARCAANRIAIEIEAALAFGTGHHGTTRGCLLALDRMVKGRAAAKHPRRRHRHRRARHRGGEGAAPAGARQRHRCPRGRDRARERTAQSRRCAMSRSSVPPASARTGFAARGRYDLILANILLEPLAAARDADGAAARTERTGRAVGAAGRASERRARELSRARAGARAPHQARGLDDAGAASGRDSSLRPGCGSAALRDDPAIAWHTMSRACQRMPLGALPRPPAAP